MEANLYSLYDVLNSHKSSLVESLDKIDNIIVRAIQNYEKNCTHESLSRKFELSMEIVTVLKHYIQILYCNKSACEDLTTKLSNLVPDKGNNNPFLSCAIPNNTEMLKTELTSPTSTITSTETLTASNVDQYADTVQGVQETVEVVPKETVNRDLVVKEEESKTAAGSAEAKLLNLRHFDWREEARNLIENKKVLCNFEWKTEPPMKEVPRKADKIENKPVLAYEPIENELQVGVTCIISHIVSPYEFYVQTESTLFHDLETYYNDDLNKSCFVVNKFSTKEEAQRNLGNFCFSFVVDRKKWFRVKIIDWLLDEPDIIVAQLIDYGETICCHFNNLKPMTELHSKFPKMAFLCHLVGISSINIDDIRFWPNDSIQLFKSIAQSGEFRVIYAHKDEGSYAIDLQTCANPEAPSVGEIMVECGCALQEAIKEEPAELTDEDEMAIDVPDEEYAFKRATLPASGAQIRLVITAYLDSCNYYGIIERDCEDFMTLKEQMNDEMSAQKYEKFEDGPQVGGPVLIKHDSEWFRGICVGKTDGGFDVFFVDLGFVKTKTVDDLRKMHEDFLEVPVQAIHCRLHKCQEKEGFSRQFGEVFECCMDMVTFDAFVVEQNDNFLVVELWDPRGLDMRTVLEKYGICKFQ